MISRAEKATAISKWEPNQRPRMQSETQEEIPTAKENRVHNSRGGRKKKPKPESNKAGENKKERTKQHKGGGDTTRTLTEYRSTRSSCTISETPRVGGINHEGSIFQSPPCEVESRSFIFLNSSISSPQIPFTAIRPRAPSRHRFYSGDVSNENLNAS